MNNYTEVDISEINFQFPPQAVERSYVSEVSNIDFIPIAIWPQLV